MVRVRPGYYCSWPRRVLSGEFILARLTRALSCQYVGHLAF
jgi:hypothetical protein